MTLLVNTFYIDKDSGEYIEEDLKNIETGRELAGFEIWRHKVYDSKIFKSLGAKFLPVLAKSDLYVENQDLQEFEKEVKILLDNVDDISNALGYCKETIKYRLNNILGAIARAKKQNGGVVID